MDKEGGVVEGPGEEKDLCGGTFTFCGSDDGGYGFEIVGNYSYNTISAIFCCLKHANSFVILH